MKKTIYTFLLLLSAACAFAQNCTGFSVAFNNNQMLTCAQWSRDLTPSVIGGIATYNYVWSANVAQASGSIATANSSGVYTVTVIDAQGCSFSATTAVLQDITPPNATISASNNLTCNEPTATLTVNTNTNNVYSWSNGQTTPNITVNLAGSYTVTVINPVNSCSTSENIFVGFNITPPSMTVILSNSLTCGTTATLTALGADSYTWRNNSNFQAVGQSITVSDAGTYTVVGTNTSNGCTTSASMIVIGYGKPIIAFSPSNGLLCSGGNGLGVQNTGQNAYLWNGGITSQTIQPTLSGVYTVTVSNNGGCSATASINVTVSTSPPQVSVTNVTNPTTCAVQDGSATIVATGGFPPYNYQWSQNVLTATATNLGQGTYTVSVADAANCWGTASVTMTVAGSTLQVNLTNVIDTVNCFHHAQATAVATGGVAPYTYYWSNGFAIPTLTLNSPNNGSQVYTVFVTDANGCQAVANVTIVSDASAYHQAIINASAPAFGCHVDSITLSITNPFPNETYMWANGLQGSTNIITPNNLWGSFYTVTVTIGSNCTASSTISLQSNNIALSNTTINANINPTNCINPSGSIDISTNPYNPNISYHWNTGMTWHYLSYLASGWYSVTMTLPGCDTIHRNYFVPAICQTTISGYALHDANNNCTRDTGDTPLSYNGYVHLVNTHTNQQYNLYIDANGFYSTVVDTGHYVITYNSYYYCSNFTFTCPSTNGINLYAFDNNIVYTENNFYEQSQTTPQYDLSVSAYQQTARPAFPRIFYIYYNNYGNAVANNTTITFTHDAAWGNLIMSNGIPPATSTPTIKTWNLGSLLANNASNNYLGFTMELPQATPIGISLNYTVAINADGTDCALANNISIWSNNVTNSFDPNDKTLLNRHDENGGILNDNSPLTYQIRFQNTGTDTAYTVVVRDTLDLTYLDKNTFKIIAASHNVQTRWVDANIVEFSFPNIYLVDSFHNERLSHGWLQFSINPKTNVPMQSVVNNTASIFFDYNDGVVTNTVHTVFVPYLGTPLIPRRGAFAVNPNPTSGIVYLTANFGVYDIIVNDVFGRVILVENNVNDAVHSVNLADFAAGTYFITLRSNGKTVTEKVIKE